MSRCLRRFLSLPLMLLPVWCAAQTPGTESRGALLYGNHCIACHNTQMHWRDSKLVTDWPSLRAQVRRWQAAALLNWSDDDVDDVARHLNESFYRLPRGGKAMGLAAPAAPAAFIAGPAAFPAPTCAPSAVRTTRAPGATPTRH